jgi:hypothetical protein
LTILQNEDFNPKSIKIGEIVGKVYNCKNWHIPSLNQSVRPPS